MPDSPNKAEKYVRGRFGVDQKSINLEKINGDYWLCPDESSGIEFETRGIRAVRDMKIGLKPTTYFLQLLQGKISRNVVSITEEEIRAFREGKMIEREMKEKGYVAMEFQERIVGCGFYMDNLVSSRIPEGRLKELSEVL